MPIFCPKVIPLTIIISFLVLSGCASTVADIKSTTPMIHKSTQVPKAAANCVVRNIDDKYGKFLPILQNGENKDNYVIRVRSDEAGNAAIIEIEPIPTGSLITTQISNHYPFKETLMNAFTDGC